MNLRCRVAALALLLMTLVPAQAGAAAPSESAAPSSTLRDDDLRVAIVTFRLARAGAALCSTREPLSGIVYHHLPEYRPADRPGMIARYGLDRGPGVLAIVPDSPAAKAGLIAGDVLLSVNGTRLPTPPAADDPRQWRPVTDSAEDQIDAALRAGPIVLGVLRSGAEKKIGLAPVFGCFGRSRLAYSKQVNAFSTAHSVVMTNAMLAFLKNDDELAITLGHELAHRILGHPVMRDSEGLLASFGIKAGALWRREADADRLGLRLAAAAGYDLGAAIPFWRRYLGKYDWYPQLFRSHPSLKAREQIVRDEIDKIAREHREGR